MKLAALATATLSLLAMIASVATRSSPRTPASSVYDDIQTHGDDVERQIQMGTG